MYFRSSPSFIWPALVLVLSISISACSLRMNEKPVESATMGLSDADSGCLSGAFISIKEFFDGNLSDEKISKLCDCTSKSLKLFVEKTKGAEEGKYTPSELRDFLERYFITDFKISDSLLQEAMNLKAAILGGATDSLTASEVDRARFLLSVIKTEMLRVRPFMPLTLEKFADPKISELNVDQALEALTLSGQNIGAALQETGIPYSFKNLEAFLGALENYYSGDGPRVLREQMELFRTVKSVVISPSNGISGNEWSRVFSNGARWYAVFLKLAHLIKIYNKDELLKPGIGYNKIGDIITEVHVLLDDGISNHPNESIAATEIYAVIETLAKNNTMKKAELIKALAPELMLLKRGLFGSDERTITKLDLQQLFQLANLVRANLADLSDLDEVQSFDEFNTKLNKFINAADLVLDSFPSTGGAYPISRLDQVFTLAIQVMPFFEALDNKSKSDLLEFRPSSLLGVVKESLVGPPQNELVFDDWRRIGKLSTRFFSVFKKYKYLGSHNLPMLYGEGREILFNLAQQLTETLSRAISSRRDQTITFFELDRAIDRLLDLKQYEIIRKLPLSPATVKNIIRKVVQKSLGGLERGKRGRDSEGLTVDSLQRGFTAFQRWYEGQRYIEGLFLSLAKKSTTDQIVGHDSFIDEILLTIPLKTAFDQVGGTTALGFDVASDLLLAIKKSRPLLRPESVARSFFSHYPEELRPASSEIYFPTGISTLHSFSDLSGINWRRQVARLLLNGYSNDKRRAEKLVGVTFDEFKNLCDDIRQLGIELKMIDANRNDMHVKRFREANLFTFAADGNNLFGIEEGTELLEFMISAKFHSNRIHHNISQKCNNGPKKCKHNCIDPFDAPYIDIQCYRNEFFSNYRTYMANMPASVNYYESLSPTSKKKFERALEEAARSTGYSSARAGSTDSEGFSLVSHYIEAILARFDEDGSGDLNTKESAIAFDVFHLTLGDYLRPMGLTSDLEKESIFTYLLAKGHAPKRFVDKLDFFLWMNQKEWWDFKADRTQVLKIMSEVGTIGE